MGRIRGRFKRQVLFLILGVIVLLVGLSAGMSFLFLEDIYIFQKKAALKGMYSKLTKIEGDSVPEGIYRDSESGNLSWIIITAGQEGDHNFVGYSRDPEKLMDVAENVPGRQAVFQKDEYVIEMNRSAVHDGYLQLIGLRDGRCVIIQSPLESMRESVSLANRFYIAVGGVICLLSLIFINKVLKVKTQPIMELVDVSQHAASLDFERMYLGQCNNELDVLGENLNRMTGTLKKTLEQLRESNIKLQEYLMFKTQEEERRRRLVTDISHELKTPLALIQGYTEGISALVKEDPEACDMYCEIIADEVQKTDRILKRLFQMNQLEHDDIKYETFDVAGLVYKAIAEQGPEAAIREAKILFAPDGPVYVRSDPDKVEEVVRQYLSNAIQYAEGEKEIRIQAENAGDFIRVSIFNTGSRIPESELEDIWIEFYKQDRARTRDAGHAGIGLAIVKTIMETLGGEYGAQNKEDGVEFWFTLELVKGIQE